MRITNLLIAVVALATVVVSCSNDDFEVRDGGRLPADLTSVATLVTGRTDGVISLSIDAPEPSRAAVWIDLDGDGIRAADESENVTGFNQYVDYNLASNVTTVSVHGDITYLGCASNELTAVDVSKSPYLITLNAPINKLTSLDVSKNRMLKRLDCSANRIATLNVSQNSELITLWSFNNELTALDVSSNRNLSFLDCSGNRLTALDVSNNNELMRLLCYNNKLSSLDVTQNSKLSRLWTYGNSFTQNETERLLGVLKEKTEGDFWVSND
ncbi:hypothetical protein [Bacteroides sp.]|uniref:hypothetical protein n=2 Tax=Bacteroides sp. TaxID=29523 RepID=UPI001B48A5AE|nr:hypothetical protein [Bacteroides sp.]MBP8621552.1 hypothetical protein [Bacteroides sp.]